jgi:type IV pilus assembly protein PilY1
MFTPSVVANGDVYTILLGSGDREKPIDYYKSSGSVRNHFFTFVDKPTVAVTTWPGAQYCGSLIICKDSLLAITNGTTPTAAQLASKQGWYLSLAATEQVVTAALTAFDTVAFNTQQPTVSVAGSCSVNLGTARAYNVAFNNGGSKNGTTSPFLVLPANTGLPPEPTGGAVIVDGVKKIVCFSCGAAGVLPPKELSGGAAGAAPKGRLYWYKQK